MVQTARSAGSVQTGRAAAGRVGYNYGSKLWHITDGAQGFSMERPGWSIGFVLNWSFIRQAIFQWFFGSC